MPDSAWKRGAPIFFTAWRSTSCSRRATPASRRDIHPQRFGCTCTLQPQTLSQRSTPAQSGAALPRSACQARLHTPGKHAPAGGTRALTERGCLLRSLPQQAPCKVLRGVRPLVGLVGSRVHCDHFLASVPFRFHTSRCQLLEAGRHDG